MRFDLGENEGQSLTGEMIARMCALNDTTQKTVRLLVEIRDEMRETNRLLLA